MRRLAALSLVVLLCCCISGDSPPKPDDAKMDSLFSSALNGTKDLTSSVTTTSPPLEESTTSTAVTVTVTTTLRLLPYHTTTTVALTPGLTCLMVKEASGAADCMRASCPTGKRCRYVPGKFYGEGGSCACKTG